MFLQSLGSKYLHSKQRSSRVTRPTPDYRPCIRNETCLHLPGKLPGYLIRKMGTSSVTPAIKWPTMATGVSHPGREIANRDGPWAELRSN